MADGTGEPIPDRGSPIVVSACLLGVACTHDATARTSDAVRSLGANRRLIPVCPETAGGLPTPRPAAERSAADGRVRTEDGTDVTDAYERGARQAVTLAEASGATVAVLKARSPSCGCRLTYDGTFSRTLVDRMGVTAEALHAAGLTVLSDEDVATADRHQ